MFYRAKITKIQIWAEFYYNFKAYTTVHDEKDLYIEVSDKEEAELLESINKAQEELLMLKAQWFEKYGKEKIRK